MKKIFVICLVTLSISFLTVKVFAASRFVGNLNSSNSSKEGVTLSGVTVSPILSTVSINKGQTLTENVSAFDNNLTPINVSIVFANFVSANEYGQPKFEKIFKSNINDGDLTVSSQPSYLLKSRTPTSIPITISAKSYALPGEYFVGVFADISKFVPGKQVQVSGAVGSLFLIRIAGNAKETGFIKSFSANSPFFTSLPVNFTTDFVDTGNVHLIPEREIDIYNMFGQKVKTIIFNPNNNIVLPVGVNQRIFSNTWNSNSLLFGQYTARLFLTYGYNKVTTVESDSTFWVVPYWIIIIIVLVFIFILWQIIARLLRRF